jgi:hypothetical protein
MIDGKNAEDRFILFLAERLCGFVQLRMSPKVSSTIDETGEKGKIDTAVAECEDLPRAKEDTSEIQAKLINPISNGRKEVAPYERMNPLLIRLVNGY